MESLLFFVLFSSLVLGVYSAVFFERQLSKYGHEGQCYDKEENAYYNQGEEMKWNSKVCGRKLCSSSDRKDFYYTEIQTCGSYGKSPECQVEVNLDLPYPDCCPRIICPTPRTDKQVS